MTPLATHDMDGLNFVLIDLCFCDIAPEVMDAISPHFIAFRLKEWLEFVRGVLRC